MSSHNLGNYVIGIGPAPRVSGHARQSAAAAAAAQRPGIRDWRVRFKEEDREKLEHIKERLDELRQGAKQQAKERLKQGAPGSLKEVAEEVAALDTKKPPHRQLSVPVLLQPALTRRREVYVGRTAMVGFFMACFWEIRLPSHPGILEQVSLVTGWDPAAVATAFLVLLTWNAFAALVPWAPTWSEENQLDVARRPPGPPWTRANLLKHPLRCLGLSPGIWGFTKTNELFHGRLAMLGFLGSLVNEVRLGGVGPMAQLAGLLGTTADDQFYHTVSGVFIIFAFLATLLAYIGGNGGTWKGEDEIY